MPPIADLSGVSEAYSIEDRESFAAGARAVSGGRCVWRVLVGTLLAAALRYCRSRTAPERVVTFVCDTGAKYLSKMYDDFWLADQGLVDRPAAGDLSDLITRRFAEGAVVTTAPTDTLLTAYGLFKLYNVSQLPVVESGRIVGIVDESDVLLAVVRDAGRFQAPVSGVMSTRLDTVPPDAPIERLLHHLRARARADRGEGRRVRRPHHPHRHSQLPAAKAHMTHKFGTLAIHAGQTPDPSTGAVITPIFATSTYVQESPGVHKGLDDGRSHNPTRWAYERCVAALEGGTDGFAFSSGMAATATVLEFPDSGSHVVALNDLYGGTRRLFERVRRRSAGCASPSIRSTDAGELAQALRARHPHDLGRIALEPVAQAGRPRSRGDDRARARGISDGC